LASGPHGPRSKATIAPGDIAGKTWLHVIRDKQSLNPIVLRAEQLI
jgi:hypothetical protein